ncbi:hypothetical protein [Pyrococcus sp. ST04]|uniref:hypothetical protein n=1 Tax=Pyrococcus sp. ST04 TaxID=1183377 RepID=UPI0002605899|nr:hypothetical protein [Pyrococcus sp. ST04]AFK22206.1 hypothetical protein Py04_0604 [Pyrococcus sp. ST04]
MIRKALGIIFIVIGFIFASVSVSSHFREYSATRSIVVGFSDDPFIDVECINYHHCPCHLNFTLNSTCKDKHRHGRGIRVTNNLDETIKVEVDCSKGNFTTTFFLQPGESEVVLKRRGCRSSTFIVTAKWNGGSARIVKSCGCGHNEKC